MRATTLNLRFNNNGATWSEDRAHIEKVRAEKALSAIGCHCELQVMREMRTGHVFPCVELRICSLMNAFVCLLFYQK